MDADPGEHRRERGNTMPTFPYKAFRPTAQSPRACLTPRAARGVAADGDAGLAPGESVGKSAARCQKRGAAACREIFPSSFESKKVSPKALENFTRLLSSLLAAGVPLSRALVILCKEASIAGRRRQMEGNPRSGGGRHVAGRCDGANRRRRFRAFTSRWWRRAKPADFSTWCWRRSPNFRRAKRN